MIHTRVNTNFSSIRTTSRLFLRPHPVFSSPYVWKQPSPGLVRGKLQLQMATFDESYSS